MLSSSDSSAPRLSQKASSLSKLGALAAQRKLNLPSASGSPSQSASYDILGNLAAKRSHENGLRSALASILDRKAQGRIQRLHTPTEVNAPLGSSSEPDASHMVPKPVRKSSGSLLGQNYMPPDPVASDSCFLLQSTTSIITDFLCCRKRKNSENSDAEKRNKCRLIECKYEVFGTLTNIDFGIEKITTAKQNFSSPSPDDTVISAQNQAFADRMDALSVGSSDKTTTKSPAKATTTSTSKKSSKPSTHTKSLDLVHELSTSPAYSKPHKSFVVIGHVDAGKSTLMGRILFDYNIVDGRTVDKLVKEAEKAGKGSFALAWILDQTSEERSHGVTIDICATDFETLKVKLTAIDAPGHRDFVPQMISGVTQADFALLVVDSINGEFEAGFMMDGQTKEHTVLARNLGIEKICVVVNKMDSENWSEDRFLYIKSQLFDYLTGDEVGFQKDQIDYIPCSGLIGNNVVKRDAKIEDFSWYSGPTLGQYLESVKTESSWQPAQSGDVVTRILKETFFLSVHDAYKDKGGIFVSGKVASGVISVGDSVVAFPSRELLQVQSLTVGSKKVEFAISGELVQVGFKASQVENDSVDVFHTGDVIASPDSPIKSVTKLIASINLFNLQKPLLVGSPFVLFRNNCQAPARISKLIEVSSGGKKKKRLLHLVSKQTAVVEIEIAGGSLAATKYTDSKVLGRIVIRREGDTVGAGTIVDL